MALCLRRAVCSGRVNPPSCSAQGLHDLRLSPPPEEPPESAAHASGGAAGDAGTPDSQGGTSSTAAPAAVTIVRGTSPAGSAPAPAGSPKKEVIDQMERLSKVRLGTGGLSCR